MRELLEPTHNISCNCQKTILHSTQTLSFSKTVIKTINYLTQIAAILKENMTAE